MNYKGNNPNFTKQAIAAGLAINDNNIEFVGNPDTKTVVWLQNGQVKPFEDLPNEVYNTLLQSYKSDEQAKTAISQFYPFHKNIVEKVELYTYYMYGYLDSFPDIVANELQPNENFRDTPDCISLRFNSKKLTVNGQPIKRLYIKMLDAMAQGKPDKLIADELGKAQTTFDFHKSKLYKILNVQCKAEAISEAYKHHLLCAQ